MTLRTGELVGIVGSNGAGKSTLLRILIGQFRPSAGHVRVGGQPIEQYARLALARRVAYLPQQVRSSFSYTCEEVVAQGRFPYQQGFGMLGRRDMDIIRQCMRWTHTDAFARRSLDSLSGGERQRVLLASVLAQQSEFLLLDEPTAALDLHHQVDVFERLYQFAREGLGVVLVTHDLNLASQYCDRLILLHEGRMIAEGSAEAVLVQRHLKKVYQTELCVEPNPVLGTPMVVLLGHRTGELARRNREELPP